MPPTLFYISLTDKERQACDQMPALFRDSNPSDQGFMSAYEFMRNAADSTQRGVAKRWITSHLSDMEHALQPIEWHRYPLCAGHYARAGFDFDEEAADMRAQWGAMVGLVQHANRSAEMNTATSGNAGHGPGI